MAQFIEPQVIATSGASNLNGNAQLSWTLGEMAVATRGDGSTILTEGFHQPEVMVTGVGSIFVDDGIQVFPVPTSSELTVKLPIHLVNSMMQIVNVEGKLVREQLLSNQNNDLNLDGLSQGIYLLQIHDQNQTSTYRIQLIQ